MIGSLLSQYLCNYLLSYSYRLVEGLHKTRRGKSIRMVTHVLFFMDDIFLGGNDRRNLLSATREMVNYMDKELGLEVKKNWNVKDHSKEPVDMMGYRIYGNGKMKIRKKIFIRGRRSIIKLQKKPCTLKMCRRVSAYYGYFKHCKIDEVQTIDGKLSVVAAQKYSSHFISENDRRANLCVV